MNKKVDDLDDSNLEKYNKVRKLVDAFLKKGMDIKDKNGLTPLDDVTKEVGTVLRSKLNAEVRSKLNAEIRSKVNAENSSVIDNANGSYLANSEKSDEVPNTKPKGRKIMTEEEFSEYNADERSRLSIILTCISKMDISELNKPIEELLSNESKNKTLTKLSAALKSEETLIDNISGMTLLHYAAAKGYRVVAERLLNEGMDINLIDKNGNTPLDCAAVNIAGVLRSHGAKTSDDVIADKARIEAARTEAARIEADKTQKNALIMKFLYNNGIKFSNIDNIKHVIEKLGVDINVRDKEGNTPLHHAIKTGASLETIEYILSRKPDVNAQNNDGDTPAHLAKKQGVSDEVGNALLIAGADMTIENNAGKAAYMITPPDDEIVKVVNNPETKERSISNNQTVTTELPKRPYEGLPLSNLPSNNDLGGVGNR